MLVHLYRMFGHIDGLVSTHITVLGIWADASPPILLVLSYSLTAAANHPLSHRKRDRLTTPTANQDDRSDAASLAVHIIGILQGTMILAVTLKRPELMAEVAERLRTRAEQ